MILQALTRYYENLLAQGKIDAPGWAPAKISFALYLDETGEVEDISENNSPAVRHLLDYGTLCCDGTVTFENGQEHHIGDPTETAIVLAAHKNGRDSDAFQVSNPDTEYVSK